MKSEEFERLKAVCEKEGFEIQDYREGNLVYVKKKDIWDGVEFAEFTGINKIDRIDNGIIHFIGGRWVNQYLCKPSTESAYIEQRKKEAFERFGEIKEGDRFDRTPIDEKWGDNTAMQECPFGNFYWKYDKSSDTLFKGRFGIYSKGKWATRVKERVEVKFDGGNLQSRAFFFMYGKDAEHKMVDLGCFKVGEFLASQLEKYLNGEIE